MIDVDSYFTRIGYNGPRAPSLPTLRALHSAHLETVPFENLDIRLGRPIVLEEDALFAKLVKRRRGGFCYELNGLFSALLRELGFRVTRLSAGVLRDDGTYGPGFDHMVLLVELEERWLADVGFGESFREPLRLDDPGDQVQDGWIYRLSLDGGAGTMLRGRPGAPAEDGYRFTFQPRALSEYQEMCDFHQTSPESSFARRRVCSRFTAEGRITVSDLRMILTERGIRREIELTEDDWKRVLVDRFGFDPIEASAV